MIRSSGRLSVLALMLPVILLVGCPPDYDTLGEGANYSERLVCGEGNQTVLLVIDPNIPSRVQLSLNIFEDNLCAAGYSVVEQLAPLANPVEVRNWLAGALGDYTGVVGAILIGDIPYAYQFYVAQSSNPSIPPEELESISYQFYADLDGTFAKSPGYVSPGGHTYSYDVHSGNVDWEIWIGVLPFYQGDYEATADVLIDYFMRNHMHRAASRKQPFVFMEIDEHSHATTMTEHNSIVDIHRTGTYAWTPFSSDPHALLYFDSPPAGLTVAQGYAAMSAGAADFTVASTHGSGQIDTTWALNNPIDTAFFWSNGCEVANLDYPDNFLTAMLYSPHSEIVVAQGATNNAGGLGTNTDGFFGHNIATSLSGGASLGQAVLNHVNTPLIWPWSDDREFHFAPILVLGDPTLTTHP